MLIKAEKLKDIYPKFEDIDDELLERRLSVIESAIRKYTNNNFQNRLFRIQTNVVNKKINWNTSYLKVDDTIEISDGPNKGLYTIKSIPSKSEDYGIETNEPLYDYPMQLITKIEYPLEVIEGAIDILDWELLQKGKEKSGVASETISRHSVSYVQRTNDNTISGYPIELFNFCNEYKKARF